MSKQKTAAQKEKQETAVIISDLTPVYRGMLAECTEAMFNKLFPADDDGKEKEKE